MAADKQTCATCVFFTFLTDGPESGLGFCRGGPISQMRIEEANRFSGSYSRPIYSSTEPGCVMHRLAAQAKQEWADCGHVRCYSAETTDAITKMRDEAHTDAARLRGHLAMLATYARRGPITENDLRQLLGDDYQEAR